MTIAGIIHQMPNKAICYAKSGIPFLELCESLKLHDSLYLAIQDEEEEIYYVDFSKYLKDQPIFKNSISNWTELEATFTEELLRSYETKILVPQYQISKEIEDGITRTYSKLTPFLSNVEHEMSVYSVENNSEIDVSYSSRKSPFTRNLKTIKWTLKDLVFTHTGNAEPVNFSNTISIVNGLACYSKKWNNELFAYEGANLLRRNSNSTKGLVLIDFSNIGDIETHLLADCTNLSTFSTNKHTVVMTNDYGDVTNVKFVGSVHIYDSDEFVIEVQLPDNASHGIPIVCIAGRLFFPYEDDLHMKQIGGKRVVRFVIKRITLEKILAANLQKFGKQIPSTGNINVDVNDFLDYLFVDHLGDFYKDPINENTNVNKYFADTCIPYISIIKSDSKLSFKKSIPIGTILPDKLRFEPNAGGLLINANTREIVDYVRIPYDSCTLVTFAPEKPLELIERDSPHLLSGTALAGTQHNYQRKDAFNPFSHYSNQRDLNDYYLLDIAKV